MPISAYDLWADGTARPAADTGVTGPGRYRWLHFDLADPELADWCAAQLPSIPGQALLQSETRPRCDMFEDGLILNLRTVNRNPGAKAAEMLSLRIWATSRTIVTVRLRKTFALDAIRAECSTGHGPRSPGEFLYRLINGLALHTRDVVLELSAATEALEEMTEDGTLPAAEALKAPRRNVLKLYRYLEPQREALLNLQETGEQLFSEDEQLHLREAVNLFTLSAETLQSLTGRLAVLRDHTDAELARQMGRNSYALSVVAALFLPLGFLTGLFGVNLAGIPGAESPLAFPILCLSLLGLGAGMLLVMRWLRLL